MNDDVQETEVAGHKWWYVTRDYLTGDEAKADYEAVQSKLGLQKGEANVAGYRVLDDFPPRGVPRRVVLVGHIEHKLREAADLLHGEPFNMHADMVYGLIARRIRWLAAAQEAGLVGHFGGHYPEGIALNKSGEVVPRPKEEQ